MNLKHLMQLQRELDAHIKKVHQIPYRSERLRKKQLALLVEIGELANETRCFKFWSHDQEIRRERALEEGADVLHFLLSIGVDIKVTPEESYDIISWAKSDIDRMFLRLYDSAQVCLVDTQWHWTVTLFLTLMESLGFTQDEIEQAYLKKNAENHRRQESGY